MLSKRQQIIFAFIGFLGLTNLVTLYFSKEILAQLTSVDSATTLAESNACAPYSQNNMHSLENQEDEGVFTAGCGGLF